MKNGFRPLAVTICCSALMSELNWCVFAVFSCFQSAFTGSKQSNHFYFLTSTNASKPLLAAPDEAVLKLLVCLIRTACQMVKQLWKPPPAPSFQRKNWEGCVWQFLKFSKPKMWYSYFNCSLKLSFLFVTQLFASSLSLPGGENVRLTASSESFHPATLASSPSYFSMTACQHLLISTKCSWGRW